MDSLAASSPYKSAAPQHLHTFSFPSSPHVPCQPGDAPLGSIFVRPKIDEKAAKGGDFPRLVESTPLVLRSRAVRLATHGPERLLLLLVMPPHQVFMAAGPTAGQFPCPGLPLALRLFPAAETQASGSLERLQHSQLRPWRGGSARLAWLCALQGATVFLNWHQTRADHRLDAPPNLYPKGGS